MTSMFDMQQTRDASSVIVSGDVPVAPAELLHPDELKQFGKLDASYKNEYLRSRYGAKLLVRERTGNAFNAVPIKKDTDGKPFVGGYPDLFLSITHAGGYAAAALSATRPVGIDIERVKPRHPALLRMTATPKEAEALRQRFEPAELATLLWTCKEAAAKADERLFPLADYRIQDGIATRGSSSWKLSSSQHSSYIATLAVAA